MAHSKKGWVPCNICKKTIPSITELVNHMKTTHPKQYSDTLSSMIGSQKQTAKKVTSQVPTDEMASARALLSLSKLVLFTDRVKTSLQQKQDDDCLVNYNKRNPVPNKDFTCIKLAADQGDCNAQWEVARMYETGIGVDRDIIAALKYFSLSAKQGRVESKLRLDILHEMNRDTTAYRQLCDKHCRMAYAAGNSEAQMIVAAMFVDGMMVARNAKTSEPYYQLVAAQGNHSAGFRLAVMYAFGINVEKSECKSLYYFSLLADAGVGQAQEIVGIFHMYGKCVQQNTSRAFAYFKLAADQGYKYSQFMTGVMLIPTNARRAVTYLQLSARNRFIPAQKYLKNSMFPAKSHVWIKILDPVESFLYCTVFAQESGDKCIVRRVDGMGFYSVYYTSLIVAYQPFFLS